MQLKILILTVSHGASHERAAAALGKALLKARPDLTVEVWSGLERCARWFRLYYDSYQIPLRYWPRLWGWIEGVQHRSRSSGPGWLYRRGAHPLFSDIETFGPDVVIATEVGMCELATMLKRETAARFRLVAVVTGVDADRAWAQPEVKTFIDSRTDIFEYTGVLKDYLDATGLKDTLNVLDRRQVQWVLFPSKDPLSYFLAHTDNWRVVYNDGVAEIFERPFGWR